MSVQRPILARAALAFLLAGITAGAYLAWAQPPAADETPQGFGKANRERIEAYIVLLRLRHDLFLRWKETGKWPDDKQANQALAGHGEYWQTQLRKGRAVLAGGMKGDSWDNVALIILEAGSEAEAQEIVNNDPAVKAYVFQAQVRPFDIHFITNKYRQAQ
jgi:uncharacterized protein YciI